MSKKTILTIVGARPQFIKCAPVSLELRKEFKEFLAHTGQHYDPDMSNIFFKELNIPRPDINLGIGSGSHAEQTGKMLMAIEKLIKDIRPTLVFVYGDTNSTLAGSLAASKLNIPVAHVEAGLRSYNMKMPEEINRIVTDKLSTYLFCPTPSSVENLKSEGITRNVYNTGDVMFDSLKINLPVAEEKSDILQVLNIQSKNYFLATLHRAENTDNIENLINIIDALGSLKHDVILPLHPRTRDVIQKNREKIKIEPNIKIIAPLSYLDNMKLLKNSEKLFTDSGGMQKEAYFLKVPCITLREETEWIETLQMGVNTLVGCHVDSIINAAESFNPKFRNTDMFGNGDASKKISQILKMSLY